MLGVWMIYLLHAWLEYHVSWHANPTLRLVKKHGELMLTWNRNWKKNQKKKKEEDWVILGSV